MDNLANYQMQESQGGKGLKYPLETDPQTGDLATLEGEENVMGCIRFLCDVDKGECPMEEDRGLGLNQLLFENVPSVVALLPGKVKEALAESEPRVRSVGVTASATDSTTVVGVATFKFYASGNAGSVTIERKTK